MSSGQKRRLATERYWVRILGPDTRWNVNEASYYIDLNKGSQIENGAILLKINYIDLSK